MSNELSEGLILGIGNPLLDISANVSHDFLKKWGLEPNGAILASEKHEGIIDEVSKVDDVKLIAGGAVQNTMRIAQWLIGKPKVCVFMGAVGDDYFGKCMELKANEEGVLTLYQIVAELNTGRCGVFISDEGKHRSLVAFLDAANKFTVDHVHKNWSVVEQAKYYYVSAFNLIVSTESSILVAKHSAEHDQKLFTFNLSAAYISQVFTEQLNSILPYVDILFGNEEEAKAFGKVSGWCDKEKTEFTMNEIIELTKKLANFNKVNEKKKRIVIITQSADPVIIAWQNEEKVEVIDVPRLDEKLVVDTNGAGDAFASGYLWQLALGKNWRQSVLAGIYAAHEIIQQDGSTLPKHKPKF